MILETIALAKAKDFVKDNWRAFVGVAAAIVLIVFTLVVSSWRADAKKLDQLSKQVAEYQEKEAASQSLSAKLAKDLAAAKSRNRKLNESLDDEVVKNRSYAECTLTTDGLLLVNQRIEGGASGEFN